jgi:hypothetical protein
LNTKRSKRWNGDVKNLTADYLKNVIEKMQAYGASAQFSKNGTVEGPNYQVINESGKKMAFDSSNLLIQPDDNEFLGTTFSPIYSLEQVQDLLAKINSPIVKVAATRARRAAGTVGSTSTPRGGSASAKAKEAIAIQKYEYYKTHRATLPSDIREHSEEITRMMEKGMSAEDAFAEAIKLCFDH